MTAFESPTSILITGASSGIGEALVLAYARPGARLALGGRNLERLEAVARNARACGAECTTAALDVTDRAAMQRWIEESDDTAPLDLVVANAGISASARKSADAPKASDAEIYATNVDGVAHTVEPALARMRPRQRGQIALMSSLAGFRPFADAPAYCASKAAVRFYGAALRRSLRRDGIGVSVICPGFVRSPMTDANDFHMPLLMDVDRAARRICKGLSRNRRVIAFPLPMYIGVRILSIF